MGFVVRMTGTCDVLDTTLSRRRYLLSMRRRPRFDTVRTTATIFGDSKIMSFQLKKPSAVLKSRCSVIEKNETVSEPEQHAERKDGRDDEHE